MPDHEFSVGDRVLCIADAPDGNTNICGVTGTVAFIFGRDISDAARGQRLAVVWDADIRGHTLDGSCQNGYGWYVWAADVVDCSCADFDPCPEEDLLSILSAPV